MKKNQLIAEVKSIKALDKREETTKLETINWINSGVELCRLKKPDVPNKHLVSYFVLVDGDYILLVDHINAKLWLPTGGHVEPNEHSRDTALREAFEELSIQAEFLQEAPLFLTSTVTVGKTAGHTDVCLWYVLNGKRDSKFTFDESEFKRVKWFYKDDIPFERTDPELARFLKNFMGSTLQNLHFKLTLMQIKFTQLVKPITTIAQVFNQWENDKLLRPLMRPNRNQADIDLQTLVTVDLLK